MKKIGKSTIIFLSRLLFFLLMLFALPSFSQNVGLSPQNNQTPDLNAGLDINYQNKGLLVPRVSLVSSTNPGPLANLVPGMLLYNTVTAGDVIPGMYYNNGQKWILVFPRSDVQGGMQYWDGSSWKTILSAQPGRRLKIDQNGTPVWAP